MEDFNIEGCTLYHMEDFNIEGGTLLHIEDFNIEGVIYDTWTSLT